MATRLDIRQLGANAARVACASALIAAFAPLCPTALVESTSPTKNPSPALWNTAYADEPSESSTTASSASSSTSQSSTADEAASGDYASWTLDDLKREVEVKTAEVERLQSQSNELAARLASVQATLDQAYASMSGAQALAEHSVKQRYKVQRQYPTLFDALLCAEDFNSFLAGIEYIEAASEVAVDELLELRVTVEKNEREKAQIETEKASVDASLAETSAKLEEATAARDEAQRKADLVANAHLNPDNADWDAGQKKFVATWAPRIDAYLSGSPLQGQGETFAKAAWKCHVDPRFSPAISTIESGKGSICIRPYNAWGWGAAEPDPYGMASEWSSWEEAINAHVRGLVTAGYAYTITPIGAQRYCPPNWELWYATTVNEMNSI